MDADGSKYSARQRLKEAPPHEHPEHPNLKKRKESFGKLGSAFFICLSFLLVEIMGAYFSGSLALLADAFHMMTDCFSLGIALAAGYLSHRMQAEGHKTYGYYRLEVLAAFVNGILLALMGAFILWESLGRLMSPQAVDAEIMLSVGLLGLLANVVMIFILHSSHHHNLNVKGALFHILGDTLASVAVVLSALFMIVFETDLPDILVSFLVGLIIVFMSIRLLRESGHVLMEGTPKNIQVDEVEKKIRTSFPQIIEIHDFHFWQITSNLYAMTAHVSTTSKTLEEAIQLIDAMNELVKNNYGITHTTFQIEPLSHSETRRPDK